MFTHVMVGANDLEKSRAFYVAALGALGLEPTIVGDRTFFGSNFGTLGIVPPRNGHPATPANGGTIGFHAETTDMVDAFHAAGLANFGLDEGMPGIRENSPGKNMARICSIPPEIRFAPSHLPEPE